MKSPKKFKFITITILVILILGIQFLVVSCDQVNSTTTTTTSSTTIASTSTSTSTTTTTTTLIPIDIEMINVTGGSFIIGVGSSDNRDTTHDVVLSSFKIGKYEVTYEQWYYVKTWAINNGYIFANNGREGSAGIDGSNLSSEKKQPVIYIHWRDSIVWCNALSQYKSLTPVYYTDSNFTTLLKVSTNNQTINNTLGSEDNPYVNWGADGYRLPTEAEWEYSARGGDLSKKYTYSGSNNLDDVSWNTNNANNSTHIVGGKLANELGLFDMTGNAYEWCWDWYGNYDKNLATNPKGPDSSSSNYRIIRGGSWKWSGYYEVYNRGACHLPYKLFDCYGLRVAKQ